MSFSSNYFHRTIGSKYTKEVVENPIKRFEMEKEQGLYIRKKYPTFFNIEDLENLEQNYRHHPSLGIGVATIPKIWGCEIYYREHLNPMAFPLINDNENPLKLREPNYDDGMRWLYEEYDAFKSLGFKGAQIGLPDLQGPLNLAVKVIGDNRMLRLIAQRSKENIVRHILEITSNVYIEVTKRLRKLTARPLKSRWSVSGCTYYYISPKQWLKYIVPIIEKCRSELGKDVRLHHCGEANSEKIKTYSVIDWVALELGFGSDLKLAREIFDNPKLGPIQISCRVSPYRMLNQPSEQIYKDVKWIISQAKGGPMSVNCVGIPYGPPEENLWAMWNAVQDYNKMKEKELEDEDDD
ncbi:MAG: uroporphyrinogen decarboxylase family protein [Promethearchaeota archaeon]